MKNISKSFNSVQVLQRVDFDLEKSDIQALTGENGAGKSTLMKILGGVYKPDEGTIIVDGKPCTFNHPLDAEKEGIVFIHQELNLLPYLSITSNCFLGKEIKNRLGVLKEKEMEALTNAKLKEIGLTVSAKKIVGELAIGHQQVVEIVKALLVPNIHTLIMDEPTAALSKYESEFLFDIIRSLKSQGVSVIYISHRMEEIFSLCDKITILRDGELVHSCKIKDIDLQKTISFMVGRELTQLFPQRKYTQKSKILAVKNLSKKKYFENISFDLYEGEIIGLAGLVGAGRTDLMHAIFGSTNYDSGQIELKGKKLHVRHPAEAIKYKMAFITEDRKAEGFVDVFDIEKNLSLTNFDAITKHKIINTRAEENLAIKLCDILKVRYHNTKQLVSSLSGGNQQKVVISKWLHNMPTLLLLDEPTRGIDTASKSEIYKIMNQLSENGVSIIMVSSELSEILGLSDRILVMRQGRISAEYSRGHVTQEAIMMAATQEGKNDRDF